MKHKTWFRLVIKAIGVLMIGLSVPQIGSALLHIGYMLSAEFATSGTPAAYMGFFTWQLLAMSVPQAAFGLYLFFGGKWIVNKCIPSNRPYCPECGYALAPPTSTPDTHTATPTHLPSQQRICPECGTQLPSEESANA